MQAVKTQSEARKEQVQSLKQRICALLDWSELHYGEYQYNAGLQYLQHYIPRDPAGIDLLATNRIYWNWWKNLWAYRDEQFCLQSEKVVSMDMRLKIYQRVHNPELLAKEIYPNGVILSDSYALMIKDVIKSEVL